MRKFIRHIPWLPTALVIIVVFALPALTQANNVELSKAVDNVIAQGANDLKPTACAGLTLSSKVTGTGTFAGSSSNDLVVGDGGGVTIDGGDGDDCILGGGGNDNLTGGAGYDICIGNGGVDVYDPSCEEQH